MARVDDSYYVRRPERYEHRSNNEWEITAKKVAIALVILGGIYLYIQNDGARKGMGQVFRALTAAGQPLTKAQENALIEYPIEQAPTLYESVSYFTSSAFDTVSGVGYSMSSLVTGLGRLSEGLGTLSWGIGYSLPTITYMWCASKAVTVFQTAVQSYIEYKKSQPLLTF